MSIQQNNYMFSLPIFNVPDYANQKPYWVVNKIDNEFWFFGAYETAHKAQSAYQELCTRHSDCIPLLLPHVLP